MKSPGATACAIMILAVSTAAQAQSAPGSMDVRWNEGAQDCKANPQPPLQVHKYNSQTYIMRENLCATFEAPFMYLLVGAKRAMLIDTGDVTDPHRMPLRETVMNLLPMIGGQKMPLLVVHTHRHLDHRAADSQFARLANVQIVGFDFDSVRRYYDFSDWPNGAAQIDLGGRVVDVIPTPGHNPTEVSFYDGNTALFFSGDFMMPGRLLIDDASADVASANRVTAFIKDKPVAYVLGGHIELNAAGNPFPWGSQCHPDEHVLQMSKDDLLALPAALEDFNGFYTRSGKFIMIEPMRLLMASAAAVVLIAAAIVFAIVFLVRRRRVAGRACGSHALEQS